MSTAENPATFAWPAPWAPIREEGQHLGLPGVRNEIFGLERSALGLAAELRREICTTHPLAGHDCTPVAYNREDENEFVFLTTNPDMPVALVHLTWEVEHNPTFPFTVGYESLEAFKQAQLSAGG